MGGPTGVCDAQKAGQAVSRLGRKHLFGEFADPRRASRPLKTRGLSELCLG